MPEIVLFLFRTSESMLDVTVRPFIVQAVCKNLFSNNASMCTTPNDVKSVQEVLQAHSARYLMWYKILITIPAAFLTLLYGAWSDRHGRKFPMVVPSIGSALAVVVYLTSLQCGKQALFLILLGASIQGAFGKGSVVSMAVISYVSDITEPEKRTQRFGRLMAMNFIGQFIGSLLSSILQTFSLAATFLVVSATTVLGVFVVVLCIPQSVPEQTEGKENESNCAFFGLSSLMETIALLFKKRKDNSRTILITLFMCININQACRVCDEDITVLFVQTSPLLWPESWYGYLMAVQYAVVGSSLLLFLPLLSNVFNLTDVTILMIGIIFKLVRSTIAGFCSQTWMMFASEAVGGLGGLIPTVMRSLISKHVREDETGKTFSLLSSTETASKLLGSVFFTSIYSASVYFFPGLAYLIESVLVLVILVLTASLYRLKKLSDSNDISLGLSEKQDYGTCEDK